MVHRVLSVVVLACSTSAVAQDGGVEAAPPVAVETPAGRFIFGGTVEAHYSFNFNQPADGVTAWRGFDNRHHTFTLSNAVLDVTWNFERVVGRLALQVGHTPSTYYLGEPALPGGPGTNASGAELWKYLQQANVGYRFDVWRGLLVDAGLYLSPIGPEGMLVKDNWNWSRSNLFYGLPFYHTGVRVSAPVSDHWTVTVAGFNGWNSVTDNNDEKSVMVQATYALEGTLAASFLYFGGVERPRQAPEGRAWRHLLDAHATWTVGPRLSLLLHLNAGAEPNALGLSGWLAGALYGRVTVADWLFVAARADVFLEQTPAGASALFWAAPWMASQTLTLEVKPHAQVSARLEYRHDEAGGTVFSSRSGVLASVRQDTLTLGLVTWF